MFHRYKLLVAHVLTSRWQFVVVFWLVLAILLRWLAPSWETVAQDGDLQFLPATSPSRIGQKWLEENFPDDRARSQMVVVLARQDAKLGTQDIVIGLDIGRQLCHAAAVSELRRWSSSGGELRLAKRESIENSQSTKDGRDESTGLPGELRRALRLLDDAVDLDEQWFEAIKTIEGMPDRVLDDRLADAYWDRAFVQELAGAVEQSKADRETALVLNAQVAKNRPIAEREMDEWAAILDVWTWRDQVLGAKLGDQHPNARMIAIQLESDFIATSNIRFLSRLEQLVQATRLKYPKSEEDALSIGVSGSAAVGGDMLRASAESVRRTEWVTIGLILLILALVYRGPMLVLVPLVSIALSLSIATSVIAMLAIPPNQLANGPGLKVFTTTRIFLVVLLFGAGTDFCLFLISRCRELFAEKKNLNRRSCRRLVASSWRSVHDALLGSAMTTIIGLSFMYFSEFEKFSNTGPIVGLGMLVTIIVCLTFTPAVIAGLGTFAFWPFRSGASNDFEVMAAFEAKGDGLNKPKSVGWSSGWGVVWDGFASWVVARPVLTLAIGMVLLGIPAIQGWVHRDWVTYDFVHELSPSSPSRVGLALAHRYFPNAEDRPLTLIVTSDSMEQDEKHWRESIEQLRTNLFVEKVRSIRSLTDPLGDYPPDRRMGLFEKDAWRRRVLENHRMTQRIYVSKVSEGGSRVARLDLFIEPNPFSVEAEEVLASIRRKMDELTADSKSPWHGAQYAITGTTPGIHDLKTITQMDQARIQLLVTLGVWGVLIVMLRKFWISGYLIFTVLLSYLTTLGLAQWFFQWAYGADFVGLDWKVPLFLFVILVAVGQDYNVYLTTRVLEEQAKHGPIRGLRRAIVSTGGIITSCGVIMAATFVSMTSTAIGAWLASWGFPAWLVGSADTPVLRGITELGFALALGVLIDTLVVRTIMVPAMFALLTRQGRFSFSRS